jgi:hypothetical protein
MTISSTNRKAGPFVGNDTATVFPFAFKVFTAADVEVVRLNVATTVETVLALTTDYTVSLNTDQNANPGGSITLVAGALATGFNLVVTSDIGNLQPTDLTNQGGFYPDVINDALDRATIQIQQLQEGLDRAAQLPITSSEDAAALVADIVRLADSADNLDIDANNIDAINTVADDITNVNTVATNIASVNTAAGSITNINTTATNIANVNAVGSDLLEPTSEINTVAVSIANVNTVGDNISNVNTVAGNNTNVTTVAGSIANVNTVGGAIANVNVTAANIANVNAVGADLLEPVSEINTVAVNIANVNAVGSDIASVNAIAPDIVSVVTVADNIANVNIAAENVDNINAFAEVYQNGHTTDPTVRNDGSPLQTGDLYFNTVTKRMRAYASGLWYSTEAEGETTAALVNIVDAGNFFNSANVEDALQESAMFVFRQNSQTVTSSQTLPTGRNAITAGPITVATGVSITIQGTSNWSIL